MSIKAILFDLDGTLADTLPDIRLALNETLRLFGFPERSKEECLKAINRGARQLIYKSLPEEAAESEHDEIVSRTLDAYKKAYASHPVVDTKPFPGVPEVLAALAEKGVKMAVISNKQEEMVRVITDALFPQTFAAAKGPGEYPAKPDPSGALALCRLLGVTPEECAFVGDSDVDMETAVRGGFLPVAVAWGYRDEATLKAAGARVILRDPGELTGLA